MRTIRFVAFLFLGILAHVSLAGATPSTTSSIMIDAKTGKVLYADNPDTLRYPASLTKLMTLYITFNALENGTLKLDDKLKVSHTAANRSPSRLGLTAGQTIDVRTAILATIVKSANDCATVLGESLAKDERSFAVLMTETAHKLGMKNTTFKNASGLPNTQQKTTARDMAVLAYAIYHHYPQYYAWFSIPEFEYHGQKYTTHNGLLKEFAGADGLKTGYTAASGYNIITSAKRGNHRVIAVTMGHEQLKQRDRKVYAMMDKGLSFGSASIDIKKLKSDLNGAVAPQRSKQTSTQTASVQNYISPKSNTKGEWAVQAGAFASYAKAEAEARSVKGKLAGKFSARGIHVDEFKKNGTSMYRAQVTGFAKADAQKACQLLKSHGTNCLVTALRADTALAQK